ncbi:MAG: GNAT family N-acetyltransferase, partial [Lachnospiraceae bacterium]|nr:GNAT family N-acetyltransferase [Lachnospiraceae bacterium]
ATDMPVGADFDGIDFLIMVTQNPEWDKLIKECYGDRAKEVTRYAIKKDTEFDKIKLQQAVNSLSSEFELRLIDQELYGMCLENEWSRDLVSQFPNYEIYEKLGLGVAALKDGILVSGASSYSRYNEGIEIEIDTYKDYRRKGLAYACGAKLILECIDRGLYPSWDAQNMWSVALAQKLGYCYEHPYLAYEVVRN